MQIPSGWLGRPLAAAATGLEENRRSPAMQNPTAQGSSRFAETLKSLNDTQLNSFAQGEDMITGKAQSLHQVVSQVEESSLALNLAVSLRNKAIEAYQEVMRIQV